MIPPLFHSIEHDGPFRRCIRCEVNLDSTGLPYIINKQFDRGECVLEFAMCHTCKMKMNEEMSDASKEALGDFFDSAEVHNEREERLSGEPWQAWMRECFICGEAPPTDSGFSVGTVIHGGEQVGAPYPLLLCDRCQGKANELLSPESRQSRDKFMIEHFPGPPTDLEPLPSTPAPAIF